MCVVVAMQNSHNNFMIYLNRPVGPLRVRVSGAPLRSMASSSSCRSRGLPRSGLISAPPPTASGRAQPAVAAPATGTRPLATPVEAPKAKRQRTWPGSAPAPQAPSRSKRPAPSSSALGSRLLTKRARTSHRLEGLGAALEREVASATRMSRKGEAYNGSEGESSESSGPEPASRVRGHHARARERVRRALAEVAFSSDPKLAKESLTFLEKSAVKPKTAQAYKDEVQKFVQFADLVSAPLVVDADVDVCLVSYMNKLYFEGHQSWRGSKLMAALAHVDGGFGRKGGRHLPRAWRALKGWLLKTPGRSRRPQPWCFWAAIAADLNRRGLLDMALYVLLLVSCYLRPSEALGLRRGDLIAPARGASRYWSLLIFQEHRERRSKTGTSDNSIPVDFEEVRPWIGQALEAVAGGDPDDFVFSFSYPDVVAEFERSVSNLGIKSVGRDRKVLYMGRHSGPSIDVASRRMPLLEVQKKGRWAAFKSVQRYEKAGRLTQSMHSYPLESQSYMLAIEKLGGNVLLGRAGDVPVPPGAR